MGGEDGIRNERACSGVEYATSPSWRLAFMDGDSGLRGLRLTNESSEVNVDVGGANNMFISVPIPTECHS